MVNLANRPASAVLEEGLHRLLAWLEQTGDDLPERLDQLLPASTIIATGEQGP